MSGVPTLLYKYMESRHVDGFMDGRVLFSRSDRHKQAIGNLTSTQMADEELRETDLLQAGGALLFRPEGSFQGLVVTEKPLKNSPAEWQGIPTAQLKAVAQKKINRPYWLWCASKLGASKLAPHYNADAVIRIDNPGAFLDGLMHAVLSQFSSTKEARVVRGPIKYSAMPFLSKNDFQAAFHKHQDEAFQQEYRVCIFGEDLVPQHDGPEPKTAYVQMGNNQNCCSVCYIPETSG